jgi:hypothetical protein
MNRLQFVLCLVAATTARADLSDVKWTDMITLSGRLESDLRFVVDNYRGEKQGEGYTFNINRNDVIIHAEIKPLDSIIGVVDARFRFYGFNEAQNLPALADRNKVDPYSFQLDQAYIATRGLPFSWLDIKAGRMQQTWGSATVFNQVDFINSRDFYDPMDYTRKVPNEMVEIDVYPTSWLTLKAVWVPVFKPAMLPPSTSLAFGVSSDSRGCVSGFPAPPLDPSQNKDLAATFGFGSANSNLACSLNFATPQVNLFMPKNTFAESQVALRAEFAFDNLAVNATYYRGRFGFPVAYNAVATTNLNSVDPSRIDVAYTAEVLYPRMQVAGIDFAYSADWMANIGLTGELAVIFPEQVNFGLRAYGPDGSKQYEASGVNVAAKPFVKATVGLDYTFTKWLYANVMYLRGFFDEFNDRYGIHNYVVAAAEFKFRNDSLALRLSAIVNVDDKSSVGNPQLTWVIAPGLEALAGAYIFGGSPIPTDPFDYGARSKFGQKAAGRSFAYLKMRMTF